MKLPNGEAAIVDIAKIRDYCLSPSHLRGRYKARVFQSALGITAAHSEELRSALLDAAKHGDAQLGASDRYGARYIIDMEVVRGEKSATVRSSWIIRAGEVIPRLVTCFVL
jgi:hypothetical protein